MSNPNLVPEALLADAATAARLCGLSRAKWFELISTGRVPKAIRTLGARCPRWSIAELRMWVVSGCPDRDRWESMNQTRR